MRLHALVWVAAATLLSSAGAGAAETVSGETLARQAQNAFRAGEYKQATKLWERAVKLDSTNAAYRDGLGKSYERQAESSSFPMILTGKARQNFVRALDLEPRNAEAMADLIELNQQPIGLCEGDLNETAALIDRLGQVSPDAAKRETIYLNDARQDAGRLGQRTLCGPVKLSRVVTGRVFPNAKLKPASAQSAASTVVAGKAASDPEATPTGIGTN